ncbi:MAG: lyase family protein, partial [Candidatus Poribacteria bacterium]
SVVDSIDARVGFNRICAALGKPWLDAGIGELSWRVACWHPREGPCYECTMDDAMRYQQHLPYAPTCAPMQEAIREINRQPTSPLAAAMSGAMMAQEALKLLHYEKMDVFPEELELPFGHQFYFGGAAPYLETQARRRLDETIDSGLYLQFGGAVGVHSGHGEHGVALMAGMARRLGLSEPWLPWHTDRQPIHALGCALDGVAVAAEKIALDVALMTQTEVGELAEPAEAGVGESSSMPHKRNPVGCARIRAAARQIHGVCGPRQVDGAEVALAHGNGGVLSSQCTVLLGAAATL